MCEIRPRCPNQRDHGLHSKPVNSEENNQLVGEYTMYTKKNMRDNGTF